MFYLLGSAKMIDPPEMVVDPVTGNKVDPPLPYERLVVLQQAEDIESLRGYISLVAEDPENDLFKQIFLPIVDDTGLQHELYMRYEWLPKNMICRVEPPVQEIVDFVPTRPLIHNPACFEAINKFKVSLEREARREAREEKRAAKASAPVQKAAKRSKKVVTPAE